MRSKWNKKISLLKWKYQDIWEGVNFQSISPERLVLDPVCCFIIENECWYDIYLVNLFRKPQRHVFTVSYKFYKHYDYHANKTGMYMVYTSERNFFAIKIILVKRNIYISIFKKYVTY